jgi:alkaline phosphatase D
MTAIDRRTFLASAGALLVPFTPSARSTSDPFSLGVASGDPIDDGVMLWTRLAPDPLLPGGAMPAEAIEVGWEVAHDEAFQRIVRRGRVQARPEAAHTVHVDVRGLDADRVYWYRFHAGSGRSDAGRSAAGRSDSHVSPIGRTRTAPRPGAPLAECRFAFASCQKYEDGHYTAHRHLASEDVRMVLFLGDYIYEGPSDADAPRRHPLREAMTLDDYRQRYALYRSDPDLQRAHQAFPWLVVWDDHELFNDYAGDVVSRDPRLRARQQAAYQAFAEHMPIRARLAPGHAALQMYRGLALGQLANLSLLDTRQYRSPHACGEGVQRPCAAFRDAGRTMLGTPQERWLFERLRSSRAHWQIVAQQIPFAPVDREAGPGVAYHMDKWAGYPAARERLLDAIAARGRHDTVLLTGDNHNHWVMELRRAADRPEAAPVAHEFLGTSISSTGDGAEQRDTYASILSENPHARYLNSRRGYVRCTVTPREWRTDFRVLPYITRPDAPITTDATFILEHGQSRITRD